VVAVLALVGLLLGASIFRDRVPFLSGNSEPCAPCAHEWTAEYIVKDPVGYLTWALAEVTTAEEKLRACVRTREAQNIALDQNRENCLAEKTCAEEALRYLKDTYNAAVASGEWPALVHTPNRYHRYTQSELMRDIASHDGRINELSNTMKADVDMRNRVECKLAEIRAKLTEVVPFKDRLTVQMRTAEQSKQREDLYAIRDLLKDLASVGDDLNAIIASSSSFVEGVEAGTACDVLQRPRPVPIGGKLSKSMGKRSRRAGASK
jgi:hypothetical protein